MLTRIKLFVKLLVFLINPDIFSNMSYKNLIKQIIIVGPESLFITMTTSFFISLVLSLQVVKEFLYLGADNLVSSMLAISFIRELSPVITSIIIIGKVASFFTAELATMVVTEQIDALFVLGISPIYYLILPRILATTLILPFLHLFSLFTSFMSSSFICFVLYNLEPSFFFLLCTMFSYILMY